MDAFLRWVGCACAASLVSFQAFGCGACIEDKMAATYDDAVVQKAAAKQHLVVFCDVKGPLSADLLVSAVKGVPGVDPTSVRTSTEPAALSFALDPSKVTPEEAVAETSRRVGRGGTVELIKTMSPSPKKAW